MALLNWIKKHPLENDTPLEVSCEVSSMTMETSGACATEETPETPEFEAPFEHEDEPEVSVAETPATRRILYVLENLAAVQFVRAMFNASSENWALVIAEGHAEAKTLQQEEPFDAVVCDFGSPSDSNEFLTWVATSHSHTHRFVMCDSTDVAFLKNWKGTPPQPIARGTNFSLFEDALQSAFSLDVWLSNAPVRALVVHMRKLPALPSLYAKITAELSAREPSIDVIAGLISEEPMITAKILQFVNSGYLGLSSRLTNPRDAVLVLGNQRTRAIVLLAGLFSKFEDARCPGFSLSDFATHSLTVANYAAIIARAETGDNKLADAAFTAGLIHDIGRLLMAANLPDSYHQVISIATDLKQTLAQSELEVYGANHADLGACLLATWGQTPAIVEAVGLHHNPGQAGDRKFSLLTAVHVANVLGQKPGKGAASTLDLAYLESIGVLEKFEAWRELCYADR